MPPLHLAAATTLTLMEQPGSLIVGQHERLQRRKPWQHNSQRFTIILNDLPQRQACQAAEPHPVLQLNVRDHPACTGVWL